ncbi:hypothetical protein Tco_1496917 [Tanacetum coccineum]
MVAFLEKSTGSAGFHQVIDFLNQYHICYALTKKPDVYISFIKQFWRSAEASTDDNGDVQIIATIDEHHLPTPNESPIHAVHSHGSDEGRLKLNELTDLVTKLFDRIGVLEVDLKTTKQTYSSAFTKLILRVKKLEAQVKIRKARRRAKLVHSDDEDIVNLSTAGGTITYTRRSAEKRSRQDNGKAIMIESDPKKKSKKEIEQERLSFAEAIRLEEQMNEEQRAQITREEEIARQ